MEEELEERQKETSSVPSWPMFLFIGIMFVSLVLGIVQWMEGENEDPVPSNGTEILLNRETCSAAGGTWNDCGSACRQDPDAPCIEVCVEQCECASDAQCPAGYVCDEFVDETGICVTP